MRVSAGEPDTLVLLRRLLLLLLAIGLLATGTDLVLLEHFEDSAQVIPLALIVAGIAVVTWAGIAPGSASVRTMQGLMVAFVAAGAVGIALHYQGNLEFQLEMDPSRSRWELFWEVIRAKAPPAMAPAAMAHLGVLGLAYTFRHPALRPPVDS